MLAAVLSGGGAGAQNSVITHRIDSADNIQSTLICEYIYPQTIACFNTEDRMTVFVLDTQSNQTISVKLKGYYIRDIAINDTKDTLFFCGYKFDYRQQGIFGFFNIHDVFFGSGYIHIHDYFYTNGNNNNYVKDLTRMVFYRRQNVYPYVACIGRTKDNYPCLVDVEIRPMGGYTSGYINNHDEKFTDIKPASVLGQIPDYILTSGTESSNGTYISLRYYRINNVISTPGDQDYINTFCANPSDMREWLDTNVLLTYVGEDILSTVSYRRHPESLPRTDNNIHVAYYNLRSLIVNHSLFSMVKSIEIPFIRENDHDATLHRYLNQRTTDKTVFLQTTPLSGNFTSTFCELDYTSLGTAGTVDF